MVLQSLFKRIINKITEYGNMVMFSHTLFSLPFAVISMLWASENQLPSARTIFWILMALTGARNGANALNRIIDHRIDSLNPRTASRHIPSGKVSLKGAWIFTVLCFVLYIFSALMLNPLCAVLSPLPLIVIFIYSYSKRFTALSHIILGAACGAAPVGAWMAVRAEIGIPAVVLGAMVALWVAGFDIIYAILDIEFDRKTGLHSIPALLGARGAAKISVLFHLLSFIIMVALHFLLRLGVFSAIGILLCGVILTAEHLIVNRNLNQNAAIKLASYSLNQMVGIVFFVFNIADMIY